MARFILLACFILIFSVFVAEVNASIAVSPSCYDTDANASCVHRITYQDSEQFIFKIYNKGDQEFTYRVSVMGYNESVAKVNPSNEFMLSPGSGQTCDGKSCQIVTIVINTSSFFGKKQFDVVAETVLSGGALPIILQARSKILIDKKEKNTLPFYLIAIIILIIVIYFVFKFQKNRIKKNEIRSKKINKKRK